jgi:hypothetical protein
MAGRHGADGGDVKLAPTAGTLLALDVRRDQRLRLGPFHGQGLSFIGIGQRTGYSRSAINDRARTYGIPVGIYRDGKQLEAPAGVEG